MQLEAHKVSVSVELLKQLDEECFENFMWLTKEDEIGMRKSSGIAVLAFYDGELIAGGYYVPSLEVKKIFAEVDPEYQARYDNAYIYSVAVMPNYRRQGIGTMLRRELCRQALLAGFRTGTTHLRRKNSWADVGLLFYKPTEHRLVRDYWPEDPESPDVEFMQFELAEVA